MRFRAATAAVLLVLAGRAEAQVRISQLFTGGGTEGAPCASDYVELFNAGAPQDLGGWSIQYASAAGSAWSRTVLPSVVLGTGEYFLVREAEGTTLPFGQVPNVPEPDHTGSIALSQVAGKLALCSDSGLLAGSQPTSAAIVDFVGYGANATWREPFAGGTAADNAPSGGNERALFRRECGESDSDLNRDDFELGFPSPRTRAAGACNGASLSAQCSPYFAEPGRSMQVTVAPYACDGSALLGATVIGDFSAIGGSSSVVLHDDGQAPDELANDGLYSALATVALGQPAGAASLDFVADHGTRHAAGHATLVVKGTGAPDRDVCVFAQPLAGPYPVSVSATFAGATAEFDPVMHESSSVATMRERRGLWYAVVGTGNTMTADTCLSPLIGGVQIPDTVLMVLCGSCDGLTQVAFGDDQPALCGAGSGTEWRSKASWCSRAGATYFVWVAPFNSGLQNFGYVLRVSDDGAPCSGSLGCDVCVPSAAGAAQAEDEPAFGPATNDGCDALTSTFRDVSPGVSPLLVRGHARTWGEARDADWFRFQAAADEELRATVTSAFPARLELHELSALGDCSSDTLLVQSTSSERCAPLALSFPVAAGNWYAVRVSAQSAAGPDVIGGVTVRASTSGYVLALELGDPSANDDCAGSFPLSCGALASGSTLAATPENGVPASCAGPGGASALTAPGVWYSVLLPGPPGAGDRTVYVETLNASFDTRLSVFEGGCGALACVTSNDDIDASGRSKVAWRATASVEYRVLVHGAGLATGTFQLLATCEPTPSNDECVDASVLSPSAGSVAGTTAGATGEPSLYPSSGPGGLAECGADSAKFDVWYRLIAPCTTQLSLDTCGALDTLVSIHSACPDANDPQTNAGACNDDGASGCAPGSALLSNVQAGASYWIRVAGADGASPGGAFTLRYSFTDSDGDGTADCFDACALDPHKTVPGQCGCGQPDIDSDGDGAADCIDGCPEDPLKVAPGVCGCGISDIDTDLDGWPDCADLCPVDPLKIVPGVCGCGLSEVDTDGDGAPDCIDGCPLDPAKAAPGACGCGVADLDADGDGTPDCVDGCPNDPAKVAPGQCGCGLLDTDSDGDGSADCVDGCPLDPQKTSPGACGCGVPDLDGDGDGVADCTDNCPQHANPAQLDCDLDGLGDVCAIATGVAIDTDGDGTPDSCELGSVFGYCTGATTANGCVATITANGTPSASASTSFLVSTQQVDGQRNGLVFYGTSGPASVPFGAGLLCVRPPRQRTPLQGSGGTAGGCNGALTLDWNPYHTSHPGALGSPFASGDVVWMQAWWRDPASPGASALSPGLQFTLGP